MISTGRTGDFQFTGFALSAHRNIQEGPAITIEDTSTEGRVKTVTLSTPPEIRFCPRCSFRMHSRGIRIRRVNHPILQDTYQLVLLLKQRRWRCTNGQCRYEENESFNFISKHRRNTNAADFLIVNEFRDLTKSAADIARKFNTSDTYAINVFDRYVNMKRIALTDAISIDEVHLDIDQICQYALVVQDFHTGEVIDLLENRRQRTQRVNWQRFLRSGMVYPTAGTAAPPH